MVKEFLSVIFRWKRDGAVIFGLIVLFSIVFAFTSRPVYESAAGVLLVPGRDKKPFIPDQITNTGSAYMQVGIEDIGSEMNIITSYPVLKSVIDRLKPDPEIEKKKTSVLIAAFDAISEFISSARAALGLSCDTIPAEDSAIKKLRANLSVNPVLRSAVISIRYRDPSPLRAMETVNLVVDAYIAHHLKVFSISGAASAINFIGDEYGSKLRAMEDSLMAFKTKSDIVNADLEYQDIQQKLTQARAKLLLLKRLNPQKITASDLANLTDDPAFAQLQSRLTDAELRYIEFSSRYGQDEGKVVASENEIREIKRFIGQRIRISLETLKELVSKYQERFNELEKGKTTINRIERKIDEFKKAYELSSQKSTEMTINTVMDQAEVSSVKVVERGHISPIPISPRKGRIILLSVFFGAALSIAFAFMRNMVSTRFFSVAEVESFTQKPVLASIPEISAGSGEPSHVIASRMLVPVMNSLNGSATTPVVSLIMAPEMGDGASFVVNTLSHIICQRPSGRALRVDIVSEPPAPQRSDKKFNLSSSITGEYVGERIVKSYFGKTDYLNVLIAPSTIPDPEDVRRFIDLLTDLGYSHIFLDLSVRRADPLYLSFAPFTSSIFIAVAYGGTKRFALLRMLSLLRHHGLEITGCIFNRRRNEIPDFLYQWL